MVERLDETWDIQNASCTYSEYLYLHHHYNVTLRICPPSLPFSMDSTFMVKYVSSGVCFGFAACFATNFRRFKVINETIGAGTLPECAYIMHEEDVYIPCIFCRRFVFVVSFEIVF